MVVPSGLNVGLIPIAEPAIQSLPVCSGVHLSNIALIVYPVGRNSAHVGLDYASVAHSVAIVITGAEAAIDRILDAAVADVLIEPDKEGTAGRRSSSLSIRRLEKGALGSALLSLQYVLIAPLRNDPRSGLPGSIRSIIVTQTLVFAALALASRAVDCADAVGASTSASAPTVNPTSSDLLFSTELPPLILSTSLVELESNKTGPRLDWQSLKWATSSIDFEPPHSPPRFREPLGQDLGAGCCTQERTEGSPVHTNDCRLRAHLAHCCSHV